MEDKLTELGETLQTQSAEYFDIVFSTAFREPLKYTPHLVSLVLSFVLCLVCLEFSTSQDKLWQFNSSLN